MIEATAPMFEETLIYIGYFICLAAAIYMVKIGHVKLGLMFITAFLLQIQSGYVAASMEFDTESQGACWATVGSYYDCLPLMFRISIHASQLGTIILGIAIYMTAKKLGSQE